MQLISKNKYVLLLAGISLIVAILMHLPEIITLIDNDPDNLFYGMSRVDVFSEVVFTIVSLLLLFGLSIFIFNLNGITKLMSWKKTCYTLILVWFLSGLLSRLFFYMHTLGLFPAVEAIAHNYLHPLRDFVIALIVVGSSYIIFLIRHNQRIQADYQALQAESLINKYEALKNQLNPHMMFNSLNTLQSLIPDSPSKAQDYVQELSHVLRYTLQENQNQSVTVREEMEFVQSFIFLLKMRYEDNLIFNVRIDRAYEDRLTPPMAIQLLIENAVKHNEISNRNPLSINIETTEDHLIVSNRIQPKRTPYNGLGIGLSNLDKRYQLMFRKEIDIKKDNQFFSVAIPLI